MAKKLSDMEKKASMNVLNDFRGEAQKLMKDKMNGLKKVTVASDSSLGLKKGLEKAEDLLKGSDKWSSEQANENFEDREDHPEMDDAEEYGHEMEEEMEDGEECDMSEDEINKKIMELMAMKKKAKK